MHVGVACDPGTFVVVDVVVADELGKDTRRPDKADNLDSDSGCDNRTSSPKILLPIPSS